jgi:tetratricopeptide (TPR) repeat protein
VDPPPIPIAQLIAAIEQHPLAKAPQKLIALDLRMRENPAEKETCIARAIADWKDADTSSLGALAAWLNAHGEFQRTLDTIPLEKSLEDRDLFLQHLDALGALGRWDEIKRLLEAERFPIDAVIQRMYLARCNAQLGQKAAAENNWQRALESAGNDLQKLATLANYAEKNGAISVAASAYETAATIAPRLRAIQAGRLRVAQAERDTEKMHAVLTEMLAAWPNDTAVQNDEAYTRLLLLPDETASREELEGIEKLADELVRREPASLPHRTLLALARLKQHRPLAALDAYANISLPPSALSPSALAVHAAVLFENGQRDEALKEIAAVPLDRLLPEEQDGTADLRPAPEPSPTP